MSGPPCEREAAPLGACLPSLNPYLVSHGEQCQGHSLQPNSEKNGSSRVYGQLPRPCPAKEAAAHPRTPQDLWDIAAGLHPALLIRLSPESGRRVLLDLFQSSGSLGLSNSCLPSSSASRGRPFYCRRILWTHLAPQESHRKAGSTCLSLIPAQRSRDGLTQR